MTNPSPRLQSRAARRRARQAEFLFDPAAVAQTMAGLPHLAAALGDPYREGVPARNLDGARKSARELYRILGNTHYGHIAQLLATLNACAGAGFTQPTLLRTRARRPFSEAIAEVHAAEHLRRFGKITGFDTTKGDDSVPDLLVEGEWGTAVVEVYCPSAWPGLAAFTNAIIDRVKNLDRGVDFEFRIDHSILEQFGPGMRLLQLHPAELSNGLDEQTRLQALGSLLPDLESAIDGGSLPLARFELPEINLVTTAELTAVAATSTPVPARSGVMSGPAVGGYRPERIFEDVVDRVIDKVKKGQAVNVVPGGVPILVVEMSQSELVSELRHQSYYLPHFKDILDEKLTDLHGYGAVAFCEAVEWGKRLATHFLVIEHDVVDDAVAHLLFP